MNNLNVVVIEGRLTRDASEGYKKGKNDVPYGDFSIAVNESRKVDGEFTSFNILVPKADGGDELVRVSFVKTGE